MKSYQRAKYFEGTSKLEDIRDPVASKKYDGAHFVVLVGQDGSTRWISRRESVKGHYPDRTDKIPHLSSTKLPKFAGGIYPVELIHTGHDAQAEESHPAISGILNSLTPRALETQRLTGPVRAVLLDVKSPEFNTYGEKMEHLKQVENAFGDPSLLFTPELKIGLDNVKKLIEETKGKGQEGVIVTSMTRPESENPRAKIKHMNTYNL